jgi:ubiquinone/menaquinone biosynthesis C-methylase UbiE
MTKPLLLVALLTTAACAHGGHHAHHGGPRHRFTDPAAMAARWDDPSRDAWQKPETMVAALEIAPGMTVTDLGTGTGYMLPHLVRAVGSDGVVIAQDIEPSMLAWVRERAAKEGWTNVRTVQGSGDAPGLEQASVDRVVMVNVWHHIEGRERFAAALAASLRQGGRIVVAEARPGSGGEGPPESMRLAPEEVIRAFEQAGLDAKLLVWENDRQYAVEARLR